MQNYGVGGTVLLTPISQVGVLPGTMNFNAAGQLGLYIVGFENANVYVPDYNANEDSQFNTLDNGGLVPLTPATLPD